MCILFILDIYIISPSSSQIFRDFASFSEVGQLDELIRNIKLERVSFH